jgi:hypothetical protein
MKFSAGSYYCLPFRYKYSHHCILKYPQSIFFPKYEETRFHALIKQHIKF